MNLATIEVPRWKARQMWREYYQAVRANPGAPKDYLTLAKSFKAIAMGRQVINLFDVMRRAGIDSRYRPRLAVARLGGPEKSVRGSWWWPDFVMNAADGSSRSRYTVRIPAHLLGVQYSQAQTYAWTSSALIPVVPPDLLPEKAVDQYHVLWEAEWDAVTKDPALLRHIAGPFYVVCGTWDLTDLERSLLGMPGE